ncbi:MAG TPA: ATP-binding protein [Capillimicrobium sp.]|jgi:anti-sigma regulatory factor (Ser/Thr protein kinase)
MPTSLVLDIPRTNRAPREARRALEELPGIDRTVLPDAKLLVSELITNSVKYGGQGPVRLVIRCDESGRVRIEVVDRGIGFIPAKRDRPKTEVGGWGLHLVETLSDQWGVYEGSTHVWFEMSARA